MHEATVPQHMLPETVDWRGSGADSEVKDQAMCGSCWAFAAVAPMETAYYRAYGVPTPSCYSLLSVLYEGTIFWIVQVMLPF